MDATAPSLSSILAQTPDPRHPRGQRHPWTALLLLVLVGLLCGAKSQLAIARWARHQRGPTLRRLGFRQGGPSQPTLHRVLKQVDVSLSLPQFGGRSTAPGVRQG